MLTVMIDGREVTGTVEAIRALLQEDGIHYISQTEGKIKISDMEDTHLRNSLVKLVKNKLDDLKKLGNMELANYFKRGVGHDSPTVLGMLRELGRRDG